MPRYVNVNAVLITTMTSNNAKKGAQITEADRREEGVHSCRWKVWFRQSVAAPALGLKTRITAQLRKH